MTKHRKALMYAVVAAPIGGAALWGMDVAFFGGASPRDVILSVLIGLAVGILAYIRPIQAVRRPNA
jgi:hypothetical protein